MANLNTIVLKLTIVFLFFVQMKSTSVALVVMMLAIFSLCCTADRNPRRRGRCANMNHYCLMCMDYRCTQGDDSVDRGSDVSSNDNSVDAPSKRTGVDFTAECCHFQSRCKYGDTDCIYDICMPDLCKSGGK